MIEYSKNNQYFSRMRMLCLCVAKEDSHYTLAQIEVNKKHIVGTNGKQLACLDNFGLDVGRYVIAKLTAAKIIICKVESGGNFPKYAHIIPPTPKNEELSVLPYDLSIAHHQISQAGPCIYIDNLSDFMDCDDYYVQAKDEPVTFYAKGFVGVVMPVNAD